MTCYHPLMAYSYFDKGEKVTTFSYAGMKFINGSLYRQSSSGLAISVETVPLPCGKCVGCREDQAKTWAIRCVNEASMYSKNCFITLTYNDEYVPNSLILRDYQLFMKRLRKQFSGVDPFTYKGKVTYPIRYYLCGEYGSKFERPHYHACLFNFDFTDKVLWSVRDGTRLYRSDVLERLWSDPATGKSMGYCTIGDVTFDSAAYVAKYVTKKITGDDAEKHYDGRTPEFCRMSRRPGIGYSWIKHFASDVYPCDFVLAKGFKQKPPRYYDNIFDLTNHDDFVSIKDKRIARAKVSTDNTPERLKTRETVHKARNKQKKRSYENEI